MIEVDTSARKSSISVWVETVFCLFGGGGGTAVTETTRDLLAARPPESIARTTTV